MTGTNETGAGSSSSTVLGKLSELGTVIFDERFGGPVARLSSQHGTATVALKGAQVLSWVSSHSTEILWLSPNADLGSDKPVRGGIPVCWPWFGAQPSSSGSPSHGFARTAAWKIVEAVPDGRYPALKLALEAEANDRVDWPYAARAELTVRLGRSLAVELLTVNLGDKAFALTNALHSYFRVGDIADVSIAGLADRPFIDQLDTGRTMVRTKSEAGDVVISAEIDRIYQQTPDAVDIADRSLARRIRIAKRGSLSTVVWNPWTEKSARLGDMGQDGYRNMVCVETANAGADRVTLAPGERHLITAEISVETL
jgi:glucose-6-phosphate 1-epimerase